MAAEIFNRVDWTWLSEDTQVLPHGWTPETGFLPYRWDNYSEMMMMYLMGLGSSTLIPCPHKRGTPGSGPIFEYDEIRYIGSFAPFFIHQYSQAWFDFRDKRDRYADYFQNSIIATDVHRRFCIDLAGRFPDYSDDLWGITASDSVHGYVVWGGPPETGPIDGTVVPAAAGGSLPFLPEATIRVLRTMKDRYGANSWCRYGFVDAFNPLTNWYDTDVIGIDTGITMLMAENVRDGFIWDTFMKNPEARRGMERAGFNSYQPSLPSRKRWAQRSRQVCNWVEWNSHAYRNSIKANPSGGSVNSRLPFLIVWLLAAAGLLRVAVLQFAQRSGRSACPWLHKWLGPSRAWRPREKPTRDVAP